MCNVLNKTKIYVYFLKTNTYRTLSVVQNSLLWKGRTTWVDLTDKHLYKANRTATYVLDLKSEVRKNWLWRRGAACSCFPSYMMLNSGTPTPSRLSVSSSSGRLRQLTAAWIFEFQAARGKCIHTLPATQDKTINNIPNSNSGSRQNLSFFQWTSLSDVTFVSNKNLQVPSSKKKGCAAAIASTFGNVSGFISIYS